MDNNLRKTERDYLEHGDAESGSKYRAALARSGLTPQKIISTLIENNAREIKVIIVEYMVPLQEQLSITFDSTLALLSSYRGHLIHSPMVKLGEPEFTSTGIYLTPDGIFSFTHESCDLVLNSRTGKIEKMSSSSAYPVITSKKESAPNYIIYGIAAIDYLLYRKPQSQK